jgi:hypothetical protein
MAELSVNKELETVWKEAITAKLEAMSRHWPGGTKETHEKTLARIARVLAQIRTEHLPFLLEPVYSVT